MAVWFGMTTPAVRCPSEIRSIREALGATQGEFAARLGVPVETYRTWDAGRQMPAPEMLTRARLLARTRHLNQPIGLDALGQLLGIHPRTLRHAARTGRLMVTYTTRTFCGRPIARATRQAGEAFKATFYRKYGWWRPRGTPPPAWPPVPANYHSRIIGVRYRLHLTQMQLAERVGAAGKAVVYQWETRKRKPSPLFWQRIEALEREVAELHTNPCPAMSRTPSD